MFTAVLRGAMAVRVPGMWRVGSGARDALARSRVRAPVASRASFARRAVASAVNHPGQVKVAHILMDPKDAPALDELYERIVAETATLAELAPEHSTCPSKSNGGVIGWIARGQTVAPFEEAAFSTPVGGVSKATTTFGVHIVQVLDARDAAPAPVDVTVADLAEVLEGADPDEVNLIDVREQDEWDAANIPRFTLKPLSQIRLWAPAATEEFDPSKPTYVMCAAGVRSLNASHVLIDQGFAEVYNVQGGINAAARAGMVRG
jgi:rhodanese-related sulfurtransferase